MQDFLPAGINNTELVGFIISTIGALLSWFGVGRHGKPKILAAFTFSIFITIVFIILSGLACGLCISSKACPDGGDTNMGSIFMPLTFFPIYFILSVTKSCLKPKSVA